MDLNTVAILSPGDMGHSVGAVLVANDLRVISCLEGRSERTRGLAEKAGIAAVNSYAEMVCEAQMIISSMVPAEVEQAATREAEALKDTGEQIVYVDCTAMRRRWPSGWQWLLRLRVAGRSMRELSGGLRTARIAVRVFILLVRMRRSLCG